MFSTLPSPDPVSVVPGFAVPAVEAVDSVDVTTDPAADEAVLSDFDVVDATLPGLLPSLR